MSSYPALLLIAQAIYIGGPEPHASTLWVQTAQATCGKTIIRVSGYGAAMPLKRRASISLNGRPANGPQVKQLLTDLSSRRAAYRLEFPCTRGSSQVTLRINRGEKLPNGTIEYHSGAATFRGDRLISYTGLQEANAETFWFR